MRAARRQLIAAVERAEAARGRAGACQAHSQIIAIHKQMLNLPDECYHGRAAEVKPPLRTNTAKYEADYCQECRTVAISNQPQGTGQAGGGTPDPGPDPGDPGTCFELNAGFPRSGSQYPYRGENSCRFPVTYVVEECNADPSATGSPVTCKQSSPKRLSAGSKDFIQYNDGKPAMLITVCNATSGRCYATDR